MCVVNNHLNNSNNTLGTRVRTYHEGCMFLSGFPQPRKQVRVALLQVPNRGLIDPKRRQQHKVRERERTKKKKKGGGGG